MVIPFIVTEVDVQEQLVPRTLTTIKFPHTAMVVYTTI